MELSQVVVLLAAGLAAGAVNAAAGGGSLISYPALLAVGVPPVSANVTNALSVAPGYFASAFGSREELARQRRLTVKLVPTAAAGTVAGTAVLLTTPESVFQAVVPYLVLAAAALTAAGPWVKRRAGRRHGGGHRLAAHVLVGVACFYGGYFNAALGLVLAAVLAMVVHGGLVQATAVKNAMMAVVGVVTSLIYGFLAPVNWLAAAVLLPATLTGGYAGARIVRKVPEWLLRVLVVTFAIVVGMYLLVT